jgi:hypothetical protein
MKDSSCRRVVAYPHQFAHLKGEGGLWGPRFGRGFGLHGGATAWGWWLPRPSPWTRTPTSRGESSAESEGSSAEEEEIRAQRRRRHKRAQKQARAKTATDDDAATTIVSEGDDSEPDDWEGDEKDEEGDEQDELLHPDQLVNANTDDSEPDYLAELNKHEAALDEQLAAMSAEEDEEGDEEDVDGEEEDWEGDEEERVEALLSSVTGEPVCKWVREEEEDVGGSSSGGGGSSSSGSGGDAVVVAAVVVVAGAVGAAGRANPAPRGLRSLHPLSGRTLPVRHERRDHPVARVRAEVPDPLCSADHQSGADPVLRPPPDPESGGDLLSLLQFASSR